MRSRTGGVLILGMALAIVGGCAALGPPALSPRAMAEYHWSAIARNDLGMATIYYRPNSTLEWTGGPLQGKYTGAAAIGEVWTKFFIAQGPMELVATDVQERQEAGRHIISARLLSKGHRAVSADYTLAIEGNRFAAETWRVRP